jgi:phage protein D
VRRALIRVTYQGRDITTALQPYLLDAGYSDHASGQADDLTLRLHDREGLWRGDWLPRHGDRIEAVLAVTDWLKAGDNRELRLGAFQVDEIVCQGGPDSVEIKAASVFASASLRQEKRTKAWEDTTFRTVAGEIARRASLALLWQSKSDFSFERLDQRDESDLTLLDRLAKERGLAVKVTDEQLVIYPARDMDAQAPIMTIRRGLTALSGYRLTARTSGVYRACELSWFDEGDWEERKTTYAPPSAPAVGQVLRVNERVESQAEAMIRAQALLRGANREWLTGEIPLMGEPSLVAGVVVALKGFGSFDAHTWFVERCEHRADASGGLRTSVSIRKTLDY